MENLTDEELMNLVTRGNLDIMQYLFNRYHVKIYNFSLKMTRDKDVSKDITQDVFYKVIKHRKTFKQKRFSSWIYTITRNLCNDYFKTLKILKEDISVVNLNTNLLDTNTEESLGNLEQLNNALNRLSQSDKALIIMSRYQGVKYHEIAEITNSTIGAVKTKSHRALHKLKGYYFLNTK